MSVLFLLTVYGVQKNVSGLSTTAGKGLMDCERKGVYVCVLQ